MIRQTILTLVALAVAFIFWKQSTSETHWSEPTPSELNEQRVLIGLKPSIPSPAPQSERRTDATESPNQAPRFYVAKREWNAQKSAYDFYRGGMLGYEKTIRVDARPYFISEDQANYPQPESACGPIALLNLYIWYTKFGLLNESVRHADTASYKQLKFKEIDQKILDIQKQSSRRSSGTHTLEQVVAMDELLQSHSTPSLRLHFEQKQPPLEQTDFLNLSSDYRAGLMAVTPKHPKTGALMEPHTVLVIRADRNGGITIANWGDFSHGRLITRSNEQWFVPNDSTQHSLRILNLTTLIPFTPVH